MSAFLDLFLKTMIPVIPTLLGLLWTKAKLLDRLEVDNKVLKDQVGFVIEQVDLMRKDIYRIQIQADRHSTELKGTAIASLKALGCVENIKEDLSAIKVIGDDQKALKDSYGKVILILDKLIKKTKD